MKPSILFCALITALLMGTSLQAQPNKKVAPALSKFINTDFMVKFHDLRIEAESAVIGIQANPGNIQGSDMYRLRAAYDQTAQRANKILETIKQDFLNKKKLKSITDFPEMYSDGLRFKLQELADFYAMHFQQPLADASQNTVDGSAIFLLVTELIGLTKGLVDHFAQIERESRMYTETYLAENLVTPYRWRYWDELSGGVSPYEKFQMNGNPDINSQGLSDPNQGQPDRLDDQIDKWNQKFETEKLNNSNNSWSESPEYPAYENTFEQDTTQNGNTENPFMYEDWNTTPPADTIPVNKPQPLGRSTMKKPTPNAQKAPDTNKKKTNDD